MELGAQTSKNSSIKLESGDVKIIVLMFVGRWDYESECRVMKGNGRSSLD